jgi:hypothetical protein
LKLTAAVLRKFAEKGMTLQDVIDLAETMEAGFAQPVPELSKAALRTRKWREKQAAEKVETSPRDVTETRHGDGHGDVSPSCARVRELPPRLVISGSDDDVDCASAISSSDDWPELKGRQTYAELLVERIASPWLDPAKSLDLVGTAGRVVAWKRDGASWEHDVVPVVTALCAKAGKRVGTWKYFDASVAQTIADNRAALAIPEARVVPLRPGGESFADRDAAIRAEARRRVLES